MWWVKVNEHANTILHLFDSFVSMYYWIVEQLSFQYIDSHENKVIIQPQFK